MPPIAGLLLRVLAIGMQVALVHGLRFNFTVDVEQCNPVIISFAGSNLKTIPAFLSVIPVNSTAISIPLQDPPTALTGIALTFLPFPVGSNFLTSLDDSAGENLILVSDLKRVLPSSTGNSSCLSMDDRRRFKINTTVSQCEEFTIFYDTSVVHRAPLVRLYSPKGPSILLNSTSDDTTAGIATYIMTFVRGREVVLLMEDGGTIRETSPLMTVLGDDASSTECFGKNARNAHNGFPVDTEGTRVVGRALIIGSATGGSAVILIGLCMAIFVVRVRRRRHGIQRATRLPPQAEKAPDDEKRTKRQCLHSTDGMVSNPIYTTSFLSPTRSEYARGSMAVVSEARRYSPSSTTSLWRNVVQVPQPPDFRASLQSLDIEGLLNMATLQSKNFPRESSESLGPLVRSSSARVPSPAFLMPITSRRHFRYPSDVPMSPDSMAFSGISLNPFDERLHLTE